MPSPVDAPDNLPSSSHRSMTAPPPSNPNASDLAVSPPLANTTPPALGTAIDHDRDREHSGDPSPIYVPSALRRVSSSISTGDLSSFAHGQSSQHQQHNHTHARDKKRLRFTSLTDTQQGALGLTGTEESYPGTIAALQEERQRMRGVPRDQAAYLISDPGTPNFSETASQIRRTLSLASVDSLLLLSADQSHREKLIAHVSRAGRDLVWRDHNEKRVYPDDTERALVLAFKRGLRSFILAASVRAGVNVVLLLFRVLRKGRLQLRVLIRAILGQDVFRFGAMVGTFTFLNTLTLHLLRLAPPLSYFRRRWKAGLFTKPSFGPPEREGNEGERRWQAAVAGAVASLGLLWETSSRRTGVAQQMFVRGLQASYNQYTPRFGIHIPHGDVLLFGLCCGQIMFAWLLSPSTIPYEYGRWILGASRVPEFAVQANRGAVRQRYIDPQYVKRALNYKGGVTPGNRVKLETLLHTITQQGYVHRAAVPCEMIHPWVDSCHETGIRRFFDVFRFMLPVYSALHLIPMLVLRRKSFQNAPLIMIARALKGIARSCSFLGVFVFIYQGLFCLRSQTLYNYSPGNLTRAILMRKETFWMIGFSCCISLFIEEKKRRAELAMYVLPRALESAWSKARSRAWVPIVPFGETILGAAAMAMVMDAYKHQPDAMSGIVRKLLYQLVGPV